MNSILKWGKEMPTSAKYIGLKTSLSLEGDEPRFYGTRGAPKFFDNADAIALMCLIRSEGCMVVYGWRTTQHPTG